MDISDVSKYIDSRLPRLQAHVRPHDSQPEHLVIEARLVCGLRADPEPSHIEAALKDMAQESWRTYEAVGWGPPSTSRDDTVEAV